MVLDRKNNPQIHEVNSAKIIRASEIRLKNGIPVYHIKAGTQDLVKIELLFPAGMWQQPSPLVASASNAMLQEGTSRHSSKEIAELLDYYGAFLETNITQDFASVAIYSLNKHLSNVLPTIEEIISDSVFNREEWDIYVGNKKQAFAVNCKKVDFVCRKKFSELIFGNDHPYGHNVFEPDFDVLKKEEAYNFYKQSYTATNTIIVASGNVTDDTLKLIEKSFGGLAAHSRLSSPRGEVPSLAERAGGEVFIEIPNSVQSSIRLGKLLFTKRHPDYLPMLVLNTVFGGYFGSRLMTNIREDKGYTYGIGSGMVSFKHAGYFTISTEVGTDVTANTIKEIYFELGKIQTEKISESELQLVRSYMLGTFLRSMDGPFALADRFKGIYFNGLDYDYYDRYVETIRTISSEKLMELANTYWKKEEMIELVVGCLTP